LYEADGPAHGIVQVDLAFDHVGPRGAVGILEIRHESRGPRVERVDDHFAVGRPGDLHAAVEQSFGCGAIVHSLARSAEVPGMKSGDLPRRILSGASRAV